MKSSCPKRDQRHSKKKWVCNVNAKFIDYLLAESTSYMYRVYNCGVRLYQYRWRNGV